MSNSTLVNYTKISPNSNPRKGKIAKITIHHMAGNMTVEKCGELFANPSREASSNYSIGSDGRVGMYVEEVNRAWTSGNADNDHQAITIEVANDGGAPDWHVSDKALAKLIELCTDICRRNGIKQLNFTGNKDGNLTMHKWFQATACPGPYLESKFPYIAAEVNKLLTPAETPENTPKTPGFSVGEVVTFKGGNHYASANSTTGYPVSGGKARVTATAEGSKHPVHLRAVNAAGAYVSGVYGWVDEAAITREEVVATPKTPTIQSLQVGDIVAFVGTTHYANANAAQGYKVPAGRAKVTGKYPGGKHPVHLRAVNANGVFIGGGVYGWVDLADIKV